jgi:trimethylamine monooxygenase
MTNHSLQWRARELTAHYESEQVAFQGDYVKSLIQATDYPLFDIEGVNSAFNDWKHHKRENILTYRDRSFRSLITGTVAPLHHTPWLAAMDDSMESFLNGKPVSNASIPMLMDSHGDGHAARLKEAIATL